MKKLTSALLAVLLAMALCCGAMAEAAVNYVDTWVLTAISMNGMEMPPASLGLEMFLIVREDGTFTLSTFGIEENGTWNAVETGLATIGADGLEDIYTLVNGKLVAESQGLQIIFSRQSEAAPAEEVVAEVVTLANLEMADFNGHWKLTNVESMGMTLPATMLGMELDIILQNGTGIYSAVTAQGSGTVDIILELEEVADYGTVLTGYVTDANGEKAETLLTLAAKSNGTLIWDASTEEMDMVFILELQPEETAAE